MQEFVKILAHVNVTDMKACVSSHTLPTSSKPEAKDICSYSFLDAQFYCCFSHHPQRLTYCFHLINRLHFSESFTAKLVETTETFHMLLPRPLHQHPCGRETFVTTEKAVLTPHYHPEL